MEKRVLLVEDEPKNLRLARDVLQARGYTTLEATNGAQGIELARKHKPHLILMDIQMPVMDGLVATRILKKNAETQDIPVIALTAYAMKGDKEKALEAGCDDYITKPIHISEFLKRVKACLTHISRCRMPEVGT
jgi:two-component system, cell cycle response regulator DivK